MMFMMTIRVQKQKKPIVVVNVLYSQMCVLSTIDLLRFFLVVSALLLSLSHPNTYTHKNLYFLLDTNAGGGGTHTHTHTAKIMWSVGGALYTVS